MQLAVVEDFQHRFLLLFSDSAELPEVRCMVKRRLDGASQGRPIDHTGHGTWREEALHKEEDESFEYPRVSNNSFVARV